MPAEMQPLKSHAMRVNTTASSKTTADIAADVTRAGSVVQKLGSVIMMMHLTLISNRHMQAARCTVPETAFHVAAGSIRAQVLISVTGVDDADGASHSGVQARYGVVKDHEGDCKGCAYCC